MIMFAGIALNYTIAVLDGAVYGSDEDSLQALAEDAFTLSKGQVDDQFAELCLEDPDNEECNEIQRDATSEEGTYETWPERLWDISKYAGKAAWIIGMPSIFPAAHLIAIGGKIDDPNLLGLVGLLIAMWQAVILYYIISLVLGWFK